MHLSFAHFGFVLAASAAASSHHLTGGETVARLSARSEETKGGHVSQKENVQMKCFSGCNGLPLPQSTSCWNAPAIFPGGQVAPPMNTFFSTVQTYTVITSNTVSIWNGGMDIQTIILQFQIMVVSLSTLLAGFQGGCPYQGNPQIFISTFAPLMIQFQSMLTIIIKVCGGNFGPFQASFAAFSVLMQAVVGIAISMQVNLQQFFSACQFNPSIWQTCGFPGSAWLSGQPGVFGPAGFGGAGGFPGVPGLGPNGLGPTGLPGGPAGIDPHAIPNSPFVPSGFGPQVLPNGPGGPGGLLPGGGGGGAFAFFSGLSSLGQLLLAIIQVLEPLFHGIQHLLEGVGLLLTHVGETLGHLLEPDHGLLAIL